MPEEELEYAHATAVKVLETNILHASDVIYWLDGSSAETESKMTRLDRELELTFTAKPRDAKLINGEGKTAIIRTPSNDILEGAASESDKARPVLASYTLSGVVRDRSRAFNPARFSVSLGTGAGESVVLYPSPLGTSSRSAAKIYGTLLWDGNQLPLSWALLNLQVTLAPGVTQSYRAQCDAHGDFCIAMTRLPPLPESISAYTASLGVVTNESNSVDVVPDTSTYTAVNVQSSSDASFAGTFALSVSPGARARVHSQSKTYLAASTI